MWQETDGELFWKISEGKTPMPGFGKEFSETDRWLLVNYIRTLAPRLGGSAADVRLKLSPPASPIANQKPTP